MSDTIKQLNTAVTAAKTASQQAEFELLRAKGAYRQALKNDPVFIAETALEEAQAKAEARREGVRAAWTALDIATLLRRN